MRLSDICLSIASIDPECIIDFHDFSPKYHIIFHYEKNIGKCVQSKFDISFTKYIKIIKIETKKFEIIINFLKNLLSMNKFSIKISETSEKITNIKDEESVNSEIKFERIPLYYESFEIKNMMKFAEKPKVLTNFKNNQFAVLDCVDDGYQLVKPKKSKKNKK